MYDADERYDSVIDIDPPGWRSRSRRDDGEEFEYEEETESYDREYRRYYRRR